MLLLGNGFQSSPGVQGKRELLLFLGYRAMGIFFLFAALNKAKALYQVEEVLLFLGVPGITTVPLSWGILVFEIALGLLVLLRIADRIVARVAVATLVVFSVVLVDLLLQPSAPHCGCAGRISLFRSAFEDNLFGLARNILFLSLCGSCLVRLKHGGGKSCHHVGIRPRDAAAAR